MNGNETQNKNVGFLRIVEREWQINQQHQKQQQQQQQQQQIPYFNFFPLILFFLLLCLFLLLLLLLSVLYSAIEKKEREKFQIMNLPVDEVNVKSGGKEAYRPPITIASGGWWYGSGSNGGRDEKIKELGLNQIKQTKKKTQRRRIMCCCCWSHYYCYYIPLCDFLSISLQYISLRCLSILILIFRSLSFLFSPSFHSKY